MISILRLLHRDRNIAVKQAVPKSLHIGVLGLDAQISGDIRFHGSLTIDGTVVGDVAAPEGSGAVLVVGQHATLRGDIAADSVLIGGRVTGNVKASERLELFGTGVLLGDVETGDIMIQGGAEFQGTCRMLNRALAATESAETAPDSAQRGRKQKGGKPDRGNGQGHEVSPGTAGAAGQSIVRQDPRKERGGGTEGSSA